MLKVSIISLAALIHFHSVSAIVLPGLGNPLITCGANAYCGLAICTAHKQPPPVAAVPNVISRFVVIPQCCKEGFYGTGLFPTCTSCGINQYAPFAGMAACLTSLTYQSKTCDPVSGEVLSCNDGFKRVSLGLVLGQTKFYRCVAV